MKKELFFKRLLSLMVILCCTFGFAQDFDYTITDGNMTVQVGADVCSAVMEAGDLLGAFFTNDSGDLQNAGYLEFTGDQLAIAVWGSETGLDNGFETGESITWMMYDSSESTNVLLDAEMNTGGFFSDSYATNALGQVLSLAVSAGSDCADDNSVLDCATAVMIFGCDGTNSMTGNLV